MKAEAGQHSASALFAAWMLKCALLAAQGAAYATATSAPPLGARTTLRNLPSLPDETEGDTAASSLTSTELILIISAAAVIVIITLVTAFVCYQRYTLGRLRTRTRRQEFNFQSPSAKSTSFKRSIRDDLRASNLTPQLIDGGSDSNRRRVPKMAHSVSEPRLHMSRHIQPGIRNPAMMGFDVAPSAYDIQTQDFSGYRNHIFRKMVEDDDDFGDIDDLVRAVLVDDEKSENKSKSKRTKSTGDPEEMKVKTDVTPSKGMVRHFSVHSPGVAGFSATMESGAQISSPFQQFVSVRMQAHRSRSRAHSPQSPSSGMSTDPLTEEELEDMLTVDPEMSTVEYDTGTDDVDGYSDF